MKKVSLGVFHYNAQYVAGRRDSYWKQTRASLIPQLKFHYNHPNWKCDLEISGHHLLFLERHFPEVLARLRQLNNQGTIELVTVHYSDQIYLAYPKRDLAESIKICNEIYDKLGLVRSPVWFGQENFYGEGVGRLMRELGYSIALVNGGYYNHFHKQQPRAAYYCFKDLDLDILLGGSNGQEEIVTQNWNFWGDGELAFAKANIYFPGYGPDWQKYTQRVLRYQKEESECVEFLTISEYINWCKQEGLLPAELEPALDGSWNHFDYGGAYLWMGTARFPFERDGYVRSLTFQSRNRVIAAEALVNLTQSEGQNVQREIHNLRIAWKHQLLAEVSDSTGQTPVKIEVIYSQVEARRAMEVAHNIILSIASKRGSIPHAIDTQAGTGIEKGAFTNLSTDDRQEISIKDFQGAVGLNLWLQKVKRRSVRVRYFKVGEDRFDLDLTFDPSCVPFHQRILSLLRTRKKPNLARVLEDHLCTYSGLWWEWDAQEIAYCPACQEEVPVAYPTAIFENDRNWIPAPNGYLAIRPDLHLVKHNAIGATHICVTCDTRGKRMGLILLDPNPETIQWRVSFLRGSQEEAVVFANRLNVWPVIKLEP